MKRSNQPPFWMLFGAGGMLSALIGAMLVAITGLAAPLGVRPAAAALEYANLLALARHPLGAAFLFAVVALFLWHAAHRIFHTLHDFGIRPSPLAWACCYGVAIAGTLAAAASLVVAR